jgi:hypothetical protein
MTKLNKQTPMPVVQAQPSRPKRQALWSPKAGFMATPSMKTAQA